MCVLKFIIKVVKHLLYGVKGSLLQYKLFSSLKPCVLDISFKSVMLKQLFESNFKENYKSFMISKNCFINREIYFHERETIYILFNILMFFSPINS